MSSKLRIAAALAIAAAPGCALDELRAVDQQATRPGGGGTCPVWGCGSNSPVIDGIGFHELDLRGKPNREGFRIVAFRIGERGSDTLYVPDVVNGMLVARDHSGAIVRSGFALEDARFDVVNDRRRYQIIVRDVGRMYLWATPDGARRLIPTYELVWTGGTAHEPNVCSHPENADGDMAAFSAVLFEGDRIDAESIRVTGTTEGWFNIGCAGHALAKQHLTGHTGAAGAVLGVTTTLAERTANLKMLSADYCGTGSPFTVAGQPVRWADENGWYSSIPARDAVVEARWTELGASCLNTPRVDWGTTPLGEATFPGGVAPLLAPGAGWCTVPPPPCLGGPSSTLGAHLVSANPLL